LKKTLLSLLVCLSCSLIGAPAGLASADLQTTLATLEQKLLGHVSSEASIEPRIEALELRVFGEVRQGPTAERIEALETHLADKAKVEPSEPLKKRLKTGVSTDVAGQRPIVHQHRLPRKPVVAAVSKKPTAMGQWTGRLSGNDPNVSVVINLLSDGSRITGTLDWKSATSGSNQRALSGIYDKSSRILVMHDEQVDAAKINRGWRFCPIEKYDLRLSADGQSLIGQYWAASCADHGFIEARKVGR
jgi:hypothetical protein